VSKISPKLKRPQQKFVRQMAYGIFAGNKLHLSEIARSLKEAAVPPSVSFLKTSARNVSVPSTADLMPMPVTTVS
jgi:hypothetical protein